MKAFKRLEGQTEMGNPRTLFRARVISAEQYKLVQEIKAFYDGETVLTRKQLRDAHGVLRDRRAAPFFISKNVACKVKGFRGVYDISRLKLAKTETSRYRSIKNRKVPHLVAA
jgi:hypothetical protein